MTVALLTMDKDAFAHCDTLDGPVVKDARLALDKGDVTGLLKWVRKERAEESVEAGREFVEVYVQYVHFIEGIHNMVTKGAEHQHGGG